MKKIILILGVLLTILPIFAMSRKKAEISLTGTVECYGFGQEVYAGLKSEDGKLYALFADSSLEDELKAASGNKITVTGRLSEENPPIFMQNSSVFEVESFLFTDGKPGMEISTLPLSK